MAKPKQPALTLTNACPSGYGWLAQPASPHKPAHVQANRYCNPDQSVLPPVPVFTLASGTVFQQGSLRCLPTKLDSTPSPSLTCADGVMAQTGRPASLLHLLVGAVAWPVLPLIPGSCWWHISSFQHPWRYLSLSLGWKNICNILNDIIRCL